MDAHLNAEWQARLTGFGWSLAAVLISQIAHYGLYALFSPSLVAAAQHCCRRNHHPHAASLTIDVFVARGFDGHPEIRCS